MAGSGPKSEGEERPKGGEASRAEREAAALRENLKRRKQQARAREAAQKEPNKT